ncbi:MAG TPA: hypothetical protein PK308_00170 [Phycisphaerales bacterium]|nr:hypothetical protein [Phycisphaerales bacterium]
MAYTVTNLSAAIADLKKAIRGNDDAAEQEITQALRDHVVAARQERNDQAARADKAEGDLAAEKAKGK